VCGLLRWRFLDRRFHRVLELRCRHVSTQHGLVKLRWLRCWEVFCLDRRCFFERLRLLRRGMVLSIKSSDSLLKLRCWNISNFHSCDEL
jgi:hypothetical protein